MNNSPAGRFSCNYLVCSPTIMQGKADAHSAAAESIHNCNNYLPGVILWICETLPDKEDRI